MVRSRTFRTTYIYTLPSIKSGHGFESGERKIEIAIHREKKVKREGLGCNV